MIQSSIAVGRRSLKAKRSRTESPTFLGRPSQTQDRSRPVHQALVYKRELQIAHRDHFEVIWHLTATHAPRLKNNSQPLTTHAVETHGGFIELLPNWRLAQHTLHPCRLGISHQERTASHICQDRQQLERPASLHGLIENVEKVEADAATGIVHATVGKI